MFEINPKQLIKAGVHFGHLTSKWNPNIKPFIFMKKMGMHIIDITKTIKEIKKACFFLKKIAKSGKKILFVSTKKQIKDLIAYNANKVNMPYISNRWLGGLLTNMFTVRRALKKIEIINKKKKDGTYNILSKKERLLINRLQIKLENSLGSIVNMPYLPSALIIVDINKEHIAVKEGQILKIPIVGIVDTDSDPKKVNFPIPGNDDSSKSINIILNYLTQSILEGLKLYNENK